MAKVWVCARKIEVSVGNTLLPLSIVRAGDTDDTFQKQGDHVHRNLLR